MKDKPKPCPSGKMRNPQSKRCIKIGGETYKKLVKHGIIKKDKKDKKDVEKKKDKKDKKDVEKKKECSSNKVVNPKTKRCITIGGKVYNEVFSKKSPLHMVSPKKAPITFFKGTYNQKIVSIEYIRRKHLNVCTLSEKIIKNSENQFENLGFVYYERTKRLKFGKELIDSLKVCLEDNSKRFIIINLTFDCINGDGHENMIIYDKTNKEIERFEPNGSVYGDSCIDVDDIDTRIKNMINKHFPGKVRKAIPPLGFCPLNNFQFIESQEEGALTTDPNGFCAAWTIWYTDLRLSNPNKTRRQVVEMAMKKLKSKGQGGFKKFIRNYANFLYEYDDLLLYLESYGTLPPS